MIAISQSEIFSWTRCPRNWYITYYLGMVPAGESPAGHRQLGSRVHTCLEGYYGYELDPLTTLMLLYKIETEAHPEYETELKEERALAEAMISGYLEWLAETGADADLQTIATETDLQVPLPGVEGVLLRARMDQVVRRISDGALLYNDFKTAASFEKHELLALDPQMRFYGLMQRLATAGQPDAPVVAGGQITTLRRVKRTAAARPPFYQRDEFRFTVTELQALQLKVMKVCEDIVSARRGLDWIRENGQGTEMLDWHQRRELYPVQIPGDCSWRCPFSAGICTMMDDGSDWISALMSSGKFRQEDPYSYYRNDALRTIREETGKL